jgi:Tol biopolymer transport system component
VRQGGFYDIDPMLEGIWVVNPQTGARARIVPGGRAPQYSRIQQKLVCVMGRQIWTIGMDGTSSEQITLTANNYYPTWSADGQLIAYDSDAGGRYGIWVANPDGTGHRLLIADARMASWHPDGQRIICVAHASGGRNQVGLVEYRITTGLMRQIGTFDPMLIRNPRVDPSGDRIAFAYQAGLLEPHIWVVNVDGTQARQLSTEPGSYPAWSEDGQSIVFTQADQGQHSDSTGVLWVVRVSDGRTQQWFQQWPSRCSPAER